MGPEGYSWFSVIDNVSGLHDPQAEILEIPDAVTALNSTGNALFLFAHQDDEFGVFQRIVREVEEGRSVWCVYFTDGGREGARRNNESRQVLVRIGVDSQRILFLGQANRLTDGALIHQLPLSSTILSDILDVIGPVDSLYLPAWEGGHPDHDAVHIVGLHAAHRVGALKRTLQYSLYNSHRCPKPFFRVLAPLKENGPILSERIQWQQRFKFVHYCLQYPSQKKTWLGLFPFVAFHYLIVGRQELQGVNLNRIYERPHAGLLYYEERNFSTWNVVSSKVREFYKISNRDT